MEEKRETRSIMAGRPDEVERLLPLVQQLYQDQYRDAGASDPAELARRPGTWRRP